MVESLDDVTENSTSRVGGGMQCCLQADRKMCLGDRRWNDVKDEVWLFNGAQIVS